MSIEGKSEVMEGGCLMTICEIVGVVGDFL